MYVVSNEATAPCGVTAMLPRSVRERISEADIAGAGEIRLRRGGAAAVYYGSGVCRYVSVSGGLTNDLRRALRITRAHIDEAVEIASRSSVYSVSDEIKNGYITVAGGHRVGIAGTAVIKEDKVSFIKDISSMNYRIACEVKGAAEKIIPLIENNGIISNTLIISPPGAGKTTLLRDAARCLSYKGYRVSIADERREIAAMNCGISAFDLGPSADVLEGADKATAMTILLRAMSPDVIITDEVGTEADIRAMEKITLSGVAVIASVHGRNLDEVRRRVDLRRITELFEVFITLSRREGFGTVEDVVCSKR